MCEQSHLSNRSTVYFPCRSARGTHACAGVQGFGHDDSNACIYVDAAGGRGMLAQKALRKGDVVVQVCACFGVSHRPDIRFPLPSA